MADIKIGALPAATALTGAEIFEVVQGGASKKATGDQISALTGSTANATLNTRLNALAPRQGVAIESGILISATLPAFGTGDFTISGLAMPRSLANTISTVFASNTQGLELYFLSTGAIRVSKRGVVTVLTSSAGVAVVDKPIHVTYSRTGGVGSIYANGVLLTSGADVTDYTGTQLVSGSTTASVSYIGTLSNFTIHNFAIPATTTSGVVGVAERYASGVWVQPSERHTAFAALTSGTLVIGRLYVITTFVAGDSFTNVGAGSNASGVTFVATGTTPTTWTNGSTVTPLAATLDLTPIGVGRVLIDRSASRNHAIVSGTTHPTYLQPAESGRIIATTNLATNQQLLALSAFDAANKYRITSWTVTSTGTPTISLGNASAGTQYVNGLTLVANTPTAVTLATSIAATANLWCNSDTTDPVTHVITYERIS
jgi:hypothetical protein